MELYRKVIIKSEDDLPKEEGYYLAMRSDGKFNNEYYAGQEFTEWTKYIDWYLQPVEPDQKNRIGGNTVTGNISPELKEIEELEPKFIGEQTITGDFSSVSFQQKEMRLKQKIYITGCGGMLGEAFYKQFKNDYILKCTDIDVNEEWLSFLDFRKRDKFRKDVFDFRPDYLFHLGAYTDLEFCELNPYAAHLTNTIAVQYAVSIANDLKIPILYISTAGIFDGKKASYKDWDDPNPINVYACTKHEGERYVIIRANKYLICRAGWMMGAGAKKDKKFIQKIMKQLKDGAKELFIVTDKDGTPTYTQDFANNVKLLIENNFTGLYNMVCGGQTSRYEIALELIKILGIDIKITPVDSSYFKDVYFAPRPASERLENIKLNHYGLNIMRDWRVALKEYIETYYEDYL